MTGQRLRRERAFHGDPHLRPGQRDPRRARTGVGRGRVGERDPGRRDRPVRLDDPDVQGRPQPFAGDGVQRAGDDRTHRGEGLPLMGGPLQEQAQPGGCRRENGRRGAACGPQRRRGVAAGHQDGAGPGERGRHAQREAVRFAQRHQRQHPYPPLRRLRTPGPDLVGRRDEVPVPQCQGGAVMAGQDDGDVLGKRAAAPAPAHGVAPAPVKSTVGHEPHGLRRSSQPGSGFRGSGGGDPFRGSRPWHLDGHDRGQRRIPPGPGHFRPPLLRYDGDHGSGHRPPGVRRVPRHDHRPEPPHRMTHHHQFRTVGKQHRHPVAAAHPEPVECRGEPHRRPPQRTEASPAPLAGERRTEPEPSGRVVEQVRQRDLGQRQFPRHAGSVEAQPGFRHGLPREQVRHVRIVAHDTSPPLVPARAGGGSALSLQ
ncbi:hypothetical protein GCM10010431_34120 [Streptomyces kunmingensis]